MGANHLSKRVARGEPAATVSIGVDARKHVHVAVSVDRLGARLGAGGAAELGRQLKVARGPTGKARRAAVFTLKTLIVNVPAEPREALEPRTDRTLIACRSSRATSSTLPRRWSSLPGHSRHAGSRSRPPPHDQALDRSTTSATPTLRAGSGHMQAPPS